MKLEMIEGIGSKSASIMFIEDSVAFLDFRNDEPFSHSLQTKWESKLDKLGIDKEQVYYTYAIKYPVYGKDSYGNIVNKEPKEQDLKACKPSLLKEIEEIDPDIIVPMGNVSLKILGQSPILRKVRGTASEIDIGGRKRILFPMLSYLSIAEVPKNKSWVLQDLKTLCALFKDKKIEVKSNYEWLPLKEFSLAKKELKRLINLPDKSWIAYDLETSSLNPFEEGAHILCISISDRSNYGVAIPLNHRENTMSQEEIDELWELIKELLESPKIRKTTHNGKFDRKWLKHLKGIEVANSDFDSNTGHYLAVTEEQGEQSLKTLAWMYTDVGGYDNVLDEYKKTHTIKSYEDLPYDMLLVYAAADADVTYRMLEYLSPKLYQNPKWENIMDNILMPGSSMLLDVECNGMKVDLELRKFFEREYFNEEEKYKRLLEQYPEVLQMEREKRKLYEKRQAILKNIKPKDRTDEENEIVKKYSKYKDYKFNWNSVDALRELLFDKLGLEPYMYTDTGKASTNEESLNFLARVHPLPSLLVSYRKIVTLSGMFIKGLPNMVDSKGYIHPDFKLTGTVTGRLASKDPNVQQLPRTTDNCMDFQFCHEIKRMFVSRFGAKGCILQFDYSSLELRCAAMISGDQNFTDIFKSGLDMHKATASKIFNTPFEEVTKDQRSYAKTVNFGILYCKSAIGLGEQLHPEYDKEKRAEFGQNLIDTWMKSFGSLGKWIKKQQKLAVTQGYVETIFGRHRRLPDAKSVIRSKKNDALRQAVNAPVQGSGSDMTVSSMIAINEYLKENNKKAKLICNVHDSIVLDCPIEELYEIASMVKKTMETAHLKYIDTDVPIVADCEVGINYGLMFGVEVSDLEGVHSTKEFYKMFVELLREKATKYITQWREHNKTDEEIQVHLEQLGWDRYISIEEFSKS